MFKNYFLVAWRNLTRSKVFSAIKISGLSIGLTVCMLIFLYTKDEISYDQFQQNKAQLFRITQSWQIGNNPRQELAITNGVMGDAFASQIPEIQQRVRVNGFQLTAKKGADVFNEGALAADDNFFSVFTFPLIAGDPKTVLKDPHSVVITKSLAKKYFGNTDPIGHVMQMKAGEQFENFMVTGLAEDPPQNSSLKTNMLVPYEYYKQFNNNTDWLGGSLNTFLMLAPHAKTKVVLAKMQSLFNRATKDEVDKFTKEQGMTMKVSLGLQPFTAMHLSQADGAANGVGEESRPLYSYILTCIAVFILIIACINFINLAVAQSLKRSKEVGIRKVVGGTRGQLIRQFLAESFLISLLAFILALALTYILLPFFNDLANKKLSMTYLADGYLFGGYFLLLMITTFLSGLYPAMVLSGFQPVKVLYSRHKLMGRNVLTKSLIVLQFALAIFLIIGTIAVNAQFKYLTHASLGYDASNLVQLSLPYSKNDKLLVERFRSELSGRAGVLHVAARNSGRNILATKADTKNITTEFLHIDDQYLPEFRIPIVSGRNFAAGYPSDLQHSVLINESFAKEAGWTIRNAIGKRITIPETKSEFDVVGVVKDYHFISLKEKIGPALFTQDTSANFGEIWVKIRPDNIPQTLALLQRTYKNILPWFPYEYHFMDEINARNYEAEARWKKIIGIASGLFIFISCIGLLGLVMLSVEQRTKEIGIRKVLGAAATRIIILISRQFILLIGIAFVIAVPVGNYFIRKWLEDFPYRIQVSWWIFALAGFLVLFIALLTMSLQSVKAATANPVKSLRTE